MRKKIFSIVSLFLMICLQIAALPVISYAEETGAAITLTLPDIITVNLNIAKLTAGEMLLIKAELNGETNYLNMIAPANGAYIFRFSKLLRLNDTVRVHLAGAVTASAEFSVSDELVCTQLYHSKYEEFQNLITVFREDLSLTNLNDYLNFSNQKKTKVFTHCVALKYHTLAEFAVFMDKVIVEVKAEKETEATDYTYDNNGGGGGNGSKGTGNTIAVLPEKRNPSDTENSYYSDISEVDWAVESINELTRLKIINGMGDGQFGPMRNVTRGEFVKMLIGAFGINEPDVACPFYDVGYDSWQYPYVAAAYQLGLVNGTTALSFGVDDFITRQDAVTLIYRFLKYANTELVSTAKPMSFSDMQEVGYYAVDAVNAMSMLGVISGIDGRFEPAVSCTRAMAAKMICFVMKLV